MIYIFQATLVTLVLACAIRAKAPRLWSSLISEHNLLGKSIATGSGFVIYAVMNYFMLDYLMLASGANFVIA
jgi:hypothetical protein